MTARPIRRLLAALLVLAVGQMLTQCKSRPKWERGKKYFYYGLRSRIGSLDPIMNRSQYDNIAQSQVYETLFQYKYLVRPFEVEPLLLKGMPKVSSDKLTYHFELKRGVRFHDDACFTRSGGKGRELTAQDVIWSMMRMADTQLKPAGWWIYKDRIAGFDAFKKRRLRLGRDD